MEYGKKQKAHKIRHRIRYAVRRPLNQDFSITNNETFIV